MKENITAKGSVLLMVTDTKTGKVIEQSEAHNLVVNLGKKNVARLIGGDATGKAVTKISVGEGTANPAVGDTALTNPFTKTVDAVTFPTDNSVQFSFSLGSTEANGMNISELGLITAGNQLFSRKTRSPIAKTSAVIITGLWTITVN